MYPENYLYSKEHEWVKVDGDVATIGITDHAQNSLGKIVFAELPEVDDDFSVGDEFGSVESVKAVAEVFMPVSGSISAINEALEDSPELINDKPHDDGWLIQVKMSDTSELDGLMSAKDYEAFAAEES